MPAEPGLCLSMSLFEENSPTRSFALMQKNQKIKPIRWRVAQGHPVPRIGGQRAVPKNSYFKSGVSNAAACILREGCVGFSPHRAAVK